MPKIGTITRKKISVILLTAAMLFSLLPAGLTAAEDEGATLIQSGNYTISADGIYQLANGYSGMITIDKSAYGVRIIGSKDGKVHPNTCIIVAERPLPLQLIIEDLKISAPDGKPGIDFWNAPGINYTNWPFKLNNAEQPAPYSLANLLRFGGDCSVTGGGGRAGVFVGDGLWLTIDKLPHLTDAQARLTAVGGGQGAGIGGDRGFSGGSVSINGGTITATGGDGGAGLGNLAGAITINGGTITATGGRSAPGLGNTSYTVTRVLERYNLSLETLASSSLVIPGETIIINGGTVTAAGNGEAGIYAMGGIKFTKDTSGTYLSAHRKSMLGRLTVNGGSVTASGRGEVDPKPGISGSQVEINEGVVSAFSNNGPGINGVKTTINGGTVIASGGSSPNEILDFFNDGLGILKDTMNSSEEAKKSQEAALAFKELENTFKSWADLLISSFLGSGGGGAGIGLYPGDSLTINDGIIIARGGPSSAGIGGSVMGGMAGMFAMNMDLTPGTITIKGGLVSATGGSGAAGIGGGYNQKAERITISGNPTVIATRGSDGAQDIGSGEGGPETLIKDQSGKTLSYIRMEVKDKTSGQPLPDKKVTVDGKSYFSNKDGLLGFFVPLRSQSVKGGSSRLQTKIMVTALASSVFPGAVTEIIPSEQNIRSTIELDFYLQNISLLGISKDNADGVPLQSTPAYDPLQADYAMEVDNAVTGLKIIPERVAGDSVTAVQVNGSQERAGEAVLVPLQIGENNILLTLTLSDDEWAADAAPLKKAYLLKVTRSNMQNLPPLMLLESNQPLDEGSVFRARYAFAVSAYEVIAPEMSAIREVIAPKMGAIEDSIALKPVSASRAWPGIWTGTWRGTVDYGDGSAPQAIVLSEGGSFDLEHRYGVGGDYSVKITLTYEDLGLVTRELNVKVNKIAPQLLGADITGEPSEEGGVRIDKSIEINEGNLLVLEGSVADPGDNTWTLTLDSNDRLGPMEVPLGTDKSFTIRKTMYDPARVSMGRGRYTKPDSHYLDLRVQDDTGLTGARRLKVRVLNVAPSVEVHGMPLVQQGIAFSGAGSFSDPGQDSWQASVDYGDGSGPQALSLNADKTFELNHIYQQTGTFTITVRVEDEDGGVGTAFFPVKVKDYLFILEAGEDATINEGETLARSISVKGPEALGGQNKVQKITVDYGDGSALETLSLDPEMPASQLRMDTIAVVVSSKAVSASPSHIGYLNLNHTYKDNGEYTVTLKLTDIDGDVYGDSFRAVVLNAIPVVSLKTDDRYTTNETFTCSGSFSDPGSDTWNATIDFDDGSGERDLKLNNDKTFNVRHSYNSQGSYTITVTVSDDDGGAGRATREVLVRNKGASSDANLYSMILGVPFAPDFDQNVTNYTITDPAGDTPLTVTAHPKAAIRYRITPNPVFSDIPHNTQTMIDIIGGDLIIQVTAEKGNTKTYTFDNTP